MDDFKIWWVINKKGNNKEDTIEWERNAINILSNICGMPEVYFHKDEDGKIIRALLFKTSREILEIIMKTYRLKVGYYVRGILFLVNKELA